ncbi:hypothetical protein VTI74DRAFT_8919 [Chaetomium olivicolor]
MTQFYRVVEHTVYGSHSREYVSATANGDADRPRLAVKQYIPLDNPDPQPGDVTIIGAHANGFPKELYEPLWDDLYKLVSKNGIRIRAIWIADMWNQGQSGVLNEKILANDPSWFDNARDLMALINEKREEMPHPLVGVGHSMGAAQLTLLALTNPRLFRSLVLIDPVITTSTSGMGPAIASTFRRDIWPSGADAAAKFRQAKFYQAWDSRVLDLWIEHGLRRVPTELYPAERDGDERVTLTTTKHQELFTFLRAGYRGDDELPDRDPSLVGQAPIYPFYRPEPLYAFKRLPELRPSVLYVFGAQSDMSGPDERREKMERTGTGVGGSGGAPKGRVKEVVLDCGHLVAMERVPQCAEAIAGWLSGELELWRRERERFEERRRGKKRIELIAVDEQWKREIKPKSKI